MTSTYWKNSQDYESKRKYGERQSHASRVICAEAPGQSHQGQRPSLQMLAWFMVSRYPACEKKGDIPSDLCGDSTGFATDRLL